MKEYYENSVLTFTPNDWNKSDEHIRTSESEFVKYNTTAEFHPTFYK